MKTKISTTKKFTTFGGLAEDFEYNLKVEIFF